MPDYAAAGILTGLGNLVQGHLRRKQEEADRKYEEELWAQKRKYFADQEKLRKKEEREYQAGLKKQLEDTTEQNRIKAVTPVAEQAAQYYAPYVQQGLMTEQDVQLATQHIMTQTGGDAAFDTMIETAKRFKPEKIKAPTTDEKFNYVMKTYFAGGGSQLSPAQWNTFRKALPEGMKDIPLTPPEGVTSVGGLRNYMKQEKKQREALKKQQEITEEIEQAKRVYKAELAKEERLIAGDPDATRLVGSFDEWMRKPDQIKKYGKPYALWRKQQLQEQIGRAALRGSGSPTGRSPAREAGFEGLPANVRAAIPPATAQGTSQAAPAGQQERMATQEQINAIQQLEEQMRALEDSLRIR